MRRCKLPWIPLAKLIRVVPAVFLAEPNRPWLRGASRAEPARGGFDACLLAALSVSVRCQRLRRCRGILCICQGDCVKSQARARVYLYNHRKSRFDSSTIQVQGGTHIDSEKKMAQLQNPTQNIRSMCLMSMGSTNRVQICGKTKQ